MDLFYSSSAAGTFIGDSARIRQVLRHLGDNAVKFTHSGHICIACDNLRENQEDAVIRISVQDTGIGIVPEMHDFIFETFTQADGSLTRRHGATGVGLALAKEIVELMGGQIGVQSEIKPSSPSRRIWPSRAPVVIHDAEPRFISGGLHSVHLLMCGGPGNKLGDIGPAYDQRRSAANARIRRSEFFGRGFRAVLSPSVRFGPHWFVYAAVDAHSSSYFPYETGI